MGVSSLRRGVFAAVLLGAALLTAPLQASTHSLASWGDEASTNTSLVTWDGITAEIRAWDERNTAELIEVMQQVGAILDRYPAEHLNRAEVDALNIDPRILDRSRHNLSFCVYADGNWSVLATTAFSATYSLDGNWSTIPIEQQYVYSSTEGLRHPEGPLSAGWVQRCWLDGIDGPYYEDANGLNRPQSGGWIYARLEGLVKASGHDSRWVIDAADYRAYREAPWEWD